MSYTQVRIKAEYRDKLRKLAEQDRRTMARQLEVLIDQALEQPQRKPGRAVTRQPR